jgi:hypothetical protein
MARRRGDVGHDGVVNEVPGSGRRLVWGGGLPQLRRRRRLSGLAGRGSGHQIRRPEGLIWCSLARICASRLWMSPSRVGGLAGHWTRAEGWRGEHWGRRRCVGDRDGAPQHSGALLSLSLGGGAAARGYGRGGGGWRCCWLRR